MPSAERPEPSVQKEMFQAEGLVNKTNFMDVRMANKTAIIDTENAINTQIADYKRLGIYEEVKTQFNRGASEFIVPMENSSEKSFADSPEKRLADMAFRFDRVTQEESAYAGESLNTLATETVVRLNELKKQLGGAAEETGRLKAAREEAGQSRADILYKPTDLSDTLQNMGEMIGQTPNVEKLVNYDEDNNAMLEDLAQPMNSKKMASANIEFMSITGMRLDEVSPKVTEALMKARREVAYLYKDNLPKARKVFSEAYVSALNVLDTAWEILNNVQNNPAHVPLEREAVSHEAASESGGLMSEAEMALLLDLAINGSKDPSFFEELMDVRAAFDFYVRKIGSLSKSLTGTDLVKWAEENLPASMQTAASWYFSNCIAFDQGIINGTAATVTGTAHIVGDVASSVAVGKVPESLKTLAHLPGLAWENRAKIEQVMAYGWENTSALQKSMLISELFGNIAGGALATAGMGTALSGVAKLPAVSGAVSKAAALARKVGTVGKGAGALALLAAEVVIQKLPVLAKYGATVTEVVEGMATQAETLALKAASYGHKATHYAEHAAHETEKAAHYAHEVESTAGNLVEGSRSSVPVYRKIDELTGDVKLASANSKELGLSGQQIASLQASLKTLDALKIPDLSPSQPQSPGHS